MLKHRPRHESRKFVNVAVLEGDRIKIVDERASLIADCPAAADVDARLRRRRVLSDDALNVQVQLALSMRRHGRGGILLVVPSGTDAWRESIVHPITYAVDPAFSELADLLAQRRRQAGRTNGRRRRGRAIDALAGLTAVDGATVMTDALRAAGLRRQDHPPPRRAASSRSS